MALGVCMCGYGVYLGHGKCDRNCQKPVGPGHRLYRRPAWVHPDLKRRLAAQIAAARRATGRVITPNRCKVQPQPKPMPKAKHPSNAASAASTNEPTTLIDPPVVDYVYLPFGEPISHMCRHCDTNPIRVVFRTCNHELLCQQCWGTLLAHSADLPKCPVCGVVVHDTHILGRDEEEADEMN